MCILVFPLLIDIIVTYITISDLHKRILKPVPQFSQKVVHTREYVSNAMDLAPSAQQELHIHFHRMTVLVQLKER